MKQKRNKIIISSKEQFDKQKPLYNGFACGHGIHGDKKYNRRKFKRDTCRLINQDFHKE